MPASHNRIGLIPAATFSLSLLLLALLSLPVPGVSGDAKSSAESWTATQVIHAEDLARLLSDKNASLPAIIYVGPHTLFAGGHIPGAVFHGAAANEQNLADFKKWAESLPRSTPIVLYCGCCPFDKCPNIRPAFAALNSLGFQKLQVLVLPTSFVKDWAEKGYPIQK
jgi:thiosulfate/3-mercaptopyruvate sulfurtransferase